jgi:acyl carrier protein
MLILVVGHRGAKRKKKKGCMDMIFERIQKIICEQFDLQPGQVTEETTLEDVDADSLDIYDLAQSLESAFDVTFHEEDLEEIKSVRDILRFIENN